ncbi:MAG: hypothetical protein ACYSWQ_21430 [Planctomycetota bacterium]|jgi:hypothetical protein
MKKVAAVVIVVLTANSTWALTFMGPPTTDIKQGQFGIGFDYTLSESDIDISGVSGVLEDVEVDTYLARIIFGLADGAEISARVGMDEIEDLDSEFAWGVGAKATLGRSEDWDWGIVCQLTGLYGDDSGADVELYEYQVAIGPTVKLGQLSVYGGPFLHFLVGDADITMGTSRISADLEEESVFGGYGGLSLQIDSRTSVAVEYQITGDADALGVGVLHLFGN